jgi:hypothetical protein
MKIASIIILLLIAPALHAQTDTQGMYFVKKASAKTDVPIFRKLKPELPSPIYDENPLWVECYWKAWELACRKFYLPTEENGFASPFVDAGFNQDIYLWDMSFITMFTNYAHPLTPGIAGLDNFYVKQHVTGEICGEIIRNTGVDRWDPRPYGRSLYTAYGWFPPVEFKWTRPKGWEVIYIGREAPKEPPMVLMEGMTHPILAWAEWESFMMTGDTARLKQVVNALHHYYQAYNTYYMQGNGLYMVCWAAMDNSARNAFLSNGGQAVDLSAEMALFADNLADIYRVLGQRDMERAYRKENKRIARAMNRLMWSPAQEFYYDLTLEGGRAPVRTVAGFWSMAAGVPNTKRAAKMVVHLTDTAKFWRQNPVPTVSAEEQKFSPTGSYWNGAVWAPTNTMVIRGLEHYGYYELAREIALKHVKLVADVYAQTGTIWENYMPDSTKYGSVELKPQEYHPVRRDFVGWSGLGPIAYFLEYAIGLRADAPNRTLTWNITSGQRTGCDRFRFGGIVTSLVADTPTHGGCHIRVFSDAPYKLVLKGKVNRSVQIHQGENIIEVNDAGGARR